MVKNQSRKCRRSESATKSRRSRRLLVGSMRWSTFSSFARRRSYKDGSSETITVREAYMRYRAEMRKIVGNARGRFLFAGRVDGLVIGRTRRPIADTHHRHRILTHRRKRCGYSFSRRLRMLAGTPPRLAFCPAPHSCLTCTPNHCQCGLALLPQCSATRFFLSVGAEELSATPPFVSHS